MNGKNTLVLNKDTMMRAIEYYLNQVILKDELVVTDVKVSSVNSCDSYYVDLGKKPELVPPVEKL